MIEQEFLFQASIFKDEFGNIVYLVKTPTEHFDVLKYSDEEFDMSQLVKAVSSMVSSDVYRALKDVWNAQE